MSNVIKDGKIVSPKELAGIDERMPMFGDVEETNRLPLRWTQDYERGIYSIRSDGIVKICCPECSGWSPVEPSATGKVAFECPKENCDYKSDVTLNDYSPSDVVRSSDVSSDVASSDDIRTKEPEVKGSVFRTSKNDY